MTIIHCEYRDPGPFHGLGLVGWLGHVESNDHTVFIVLSREPLVGVGSITAHHSRRLDTDSCPSMVHELDLLDVDRLWVQAEDDVVQSQLLSILDLGLSTAQNGVVVAAVL